MFLAFFPHFVKNLLSLWTRGDLYTTSFARYAARVDVEEFASLFAMSLIFDVTDFSCLCCDS